MSWLKQLFCNHEYRWMRNIYGDEIMYSGWNRSKWLCDKCGKIENRAELNQVKQ